MKMREISATHERVATRHYVQGGSDRAFGIVIASVLTLLALWPAFEGGPVRGWFFAVAAPLLVVALWRPALLSPLNRVWTRIGWLLSRVTNPLIMGVVFYTTITPIGVLLRLAGKDVLRLRLDRDSASYWIERRPPGPGPDTMLRQF